MVFSSKSSNCSTKFAVHELVYQKKPSEATLVRFDPGGNPNQAREASGFVGPAVTSFHSLAIVSVIVTLPQTVSPTIDAGSKSQLKGSLMIPSSPPSSASQASIALSVMLSQTQASGNVVSRTWTRYGHRDAVLNRGQSATGAAASTPSK